MKFNATQIPYQATGLFSQLVRDYVEGKKTALDFVEYAPNFEGVQKAMGEYVYKFWHLLDETLNAILFILILICMTVIITVVNWNNDQN